ncbi:MAG: hypothetical protein J3Q66DRAFT_338042 [Benniella sp.]|nr:MAG: hypothetical protein J3Q66DRAFT_338042 [Benniella sp.]
MHIKSKDIAPNEVIKVMEPTSSESMTRNPVLWHPSSEFFVIGKDKDIAAHNRHTWKKTTAQPVRCVAFSPIGRFLAASSHNHANGEITSIAWVPGANQLLYGDTVGKVSCLDNLINSEKGTPFDQPKPDPLEGLFDDAAMVQDYASGDESLGDFIVEDETGTYLEMKRVSAIQKSTLKTQPVKELHPRFQSGSSRRDDRRYLGILYLLSLITSVNHGTHAKVSVEFHDKVAHRGFHFMDNFRYSMACLGRQSQYGVYQTYDSWATKSEWQVYLLDGEDVTAIALNAESANVATSRGYVRIFSQSRIQRALFSVLTTLFTLLQCLSSARL